jgi:hypothetical protein
MQGSGSIPDTLEAVNRYSRGFFTAKSSHGAINDRIAPWLVSLDAGEGTAFGKQLLDVFGGVRFGVDTQQRLGS